MPRIVRGNVVLHVKDEEVQHYLNMGYSVTTPMGTVKRAAIPSDSGTLKKGYVDSLEKIATLEAEVVKLTAENEELKRALSAKKTTKSKG